MMNILVP